MFLNFLVFLPCFVSLALLFVCLVLRSKKYKSSYIITLCAYTFIYFFCDAFYHGSTVNYGTFVCMEVVGQYAILGTFPAFIMYYNYECTFRQPPKWFPVTFMPSTIIGTIGLFCLASIGKTELAQFAENIDWEYGALPMDCSRIEALYYYNGRVVTPILMIVMMIITAGHMIYIYIKNKKEGELNRRQHGILSAALFTIIFGLIKVGCGRQISVAYDAINGALSGMIALGVTGIASCHVMHSQNREEVAEKVNEEVTQEKALEQEQKNVQRLKQKFIKYFKENDPFLDPELSLDKVADALGTNRTYISMIVNNSYGKPFREYVNELRIEYAKKYILEHKDAKFEDVAQASGFQSGAQFSRKFKEVTGVSPMAWSRQSH